MRRMILAFLLSTLIVAGPAFAQTPPPTQQTPPAQQAPPPAPAPVPFPADAKIAFISLEAVVQQSALGKVGQKQMADLSERKNTEISLKNKEITALQEKQRSQQNIASQDTLNQMSRDLDRMGRELQFLQQQAQVDIESLNEELLQSFQRRVLPIVEQIRAERGLWAVFVVPDSSPAAVHPGLDLSAEVIKRLDAAK